MARHYAQSDDTGSHPFQDDGIDVPTVENESPMVPAYTPQGYEQNQVSRGGRILGLALFGLFTLLLMIVTPLIFPFLHSLAFKVLACTTSLPAFFLGRAELRSMRAGAMNRDGIWLTRAGMVLGGLVTLVAIGLAAMPLVIAFIGIW